MNIVFFSIFKIVYNVPRLVFRWQIQHQAVTNINKSLNLTASCQKYHKTCHLKQTDVAHSIIFSRTEKFNATFIHKVWFGFQFSAKFFVENCLYIAKNPRIVFEGFPQSLVFGFKYYTKFFG